MRLNTSLGLSGASLALSPPAGKPKALRLGFHPTSVAFRAARPRSRKIIVYIATSADGFIARPDGSVDWLDRPRPKAGYGMGAFYKRFDRILCGEGRRTNAETSMTSNTGKRRFAFAQEFPKRSIGRVELQTTIGWDGPSASRTRHPFAGTVVDPRPRRLS